ncbi:tripartite tricarboxylate transporter permease [Ferrovibrio sp.]|uniref:tripartite tricarboxylate transporter permease n=1 Tax=Ferrovibrio sp. TaxID=1917215 RepID=UPI001B6612B8|nr:tripartite tricarboxylate transporter permease [Ferrovibrio sp.]MBP7063279.1 tripartite tricarboxylate transporter permease [Ferrovibrio sp.]
MFEALQLLGHGFSLAIQPENLLYALIGSLLGTLVGVLPGLGPVTTIAVLLPITYQVGSPLGALIMLAAIYYGAMYGGSTTSILLKVPGEAASVITCLDGYEMAKRGRAGPALAIAAIGSFVAGTVAVVGLSLIGPLFARYALSFGPPEYFALALFGLILASTLSGGPPLHGLCMVFIGILLGLVGLDTMTGDARFSFGILDLTNGIGIVPLMMGIFGLGEILHNMEQRGGAKLITDKIGRIMPSRQDWKDSAGPIGRGSVLGFLLGLIPGGGAILAALISYTVEKTLSKKPEEFGKGAIAGVAGPESANNAAASAAFIPLLTLGIPGNAVTAVLLAALLIQNIEPGPLMLVKHADVFWGVIASMYVGNVMLLILNLPLVGLWVQLLRVPSWVLNAVVLTIAILGAYSLRNAWFDVGVLVAGGAIGYVFRKANLEASPLIMAFILADLLDTSLRQALLMGDGSPLILISRPMSAVILVLGLGILVLQLLTWRRSARALGLQQEDGTT